ncbi:hypothetical protein V1478_013945 [Vespula squamosa]|uniref:Uncharacterized protein n=1 Tax=Vespula squamosa TaxID=30214 RepID=A0ABD2A6M3_VESSQ
MPLVKLGLSGIYSKAGRFFACRELCPVQALRGGTRFLTSLVLYFLFTMTVVLFIAVLVVILVLVVLRYFRTRISGRIERLVPFNSNRLRCKLRQTARRKSKLCWTL